MILTTIMQSNSDYSELFHNSLRKSGYCGRVRIVDQINGCKKQITSARYFEYWKILIELIEDDQLILTDARDVIFQKNPEIFMPRSGLHVYQEDEMHCIGEENYNLNWIKMAYGNEVLKQLFYKPIICAGIIAGGWDEVKEYNKILVNEIERLPDFTGADQAAHNYLIYSGKVNCTIHNNYDEVYTMCLVPPEAFKFKDGVINNGDNIPCMVHQYDRHPALVKEFNKLYRE